MKIKHLKDIPKTIAHKTLWRQKLADVGELNSGVQTVNYVEMKPGDTFEAHSHNDCEEYFYIIEGTSIGIIADKEIELNKGDFLIVEKNEQHTFINRSKSLFTFFAIRVLSND